MLHVDFISHALIVSPLYRDTLIISLKGILKFSYLFSGITCIYTVHKLDKTLLIGFGCHRNNILENLMGDKDPFIVAHAESLEW